MLHIEVWIWNWFKKNVGHLKILLFYMHVYQFVNIERERELFHTVIVAQNFIQRTQSYLNRIFTDIFLVCIDFEVNFHFFAFLHDFFYYSETIAAHATTAITCYRSDFKCTVFTHSNILIIAEEINGLRPQVKDQTIPLYSIHTVMFGAYH